jgi:hypothetical protein
MAFLSIVASLTSKRPIVSEKVTDPIELPPFRQRDVLNGIITTVSETGDPSAPTQDAVVTGSSGIGLTDGMSVVYAQATAVQVQNGNEITFTIAVNSTTLTSAFADTTDDSIEAFFEARITQGGQDELLLREAVTIQTSAL